MSACSKLWLVLAIAIGMFAAPMRAQYVYVANFDSNNVSAYSIGANGVLMPVPGSPFAAGINPISVAVDPTAQYVYVANMGANNVSAYSIGANGTLMPVPGSPFKAGIGPLSVAVGPMGKFAYVANQTGNDVSAFRIGANGGLAPVPGSPFKAGDLPESVAVDSTGKFVYAYMWQTGPAVSQPTASMPTEPRDRSQGRPSQRGIAPSQSHWIQRVSSPTWPTMAAITSRPTASVPTGI